MTNPIAVRTGLYTGIVAYLLGQAFDTYWHARNLSFVPEPPSALWRIHLGIWLGSLLVALVGAGLVARPGMRITGGLLLLGGLLQLLGFGWDMYLHSQERSRDLWHDLLWYGFGVVVIGLARFEALSRRSVNQAKDPVFTSSGGSR